MDSHGSANDLQGKRITVIDQSQRPGLASHAPTGGVVFDTERKHLDEKPGIFRKRHEWEETAIQAGTDATLSWQYRHSSITPVIASQKSGIPVTGELDFLAPFLGDGLTVLRKHGKAPQAHLGPMLTRKGYSFSVTEQRDLLATRPPELVISRGGAEQSLY